MSIIALFGLHEPIDVIDIKCTSLDVYTKTKSLVKVSKSMSQCVNDLRPKYGIAFCTSNAYWTPKYPIMQNKNTEAHYISLLIFKLLNITVQYLLNDAPFSRMLHGILEDIQIGTPSIDQIFHQFWSCSELDLITKFDLYPTCSYASFPQKTIATGIACQHRTLTPPEISSCPAFGLACVLMLRPISPKIVIFLDFWGWNIPRFTLLYL